MTLPTFYHIEGRATLYSIYIVDIRAFDTPRVLSVTGFRASRCVMGRAMAGASWSQPRGSECTEARHALSLLGVTT